MPSQTTRFLDGARSLQYIERQIKPIATEEGVRFTVWLDESSFEFVITRQALEDLATVRALGQCDLLALFHQHHARIEALALELIDAGVRWPKLVIRMQDVH